MAKSSKSSGEFMWDRLQEAAGLLCFLAMAYLLLCLLTYHPADPSFNNATQTMRLHNGGGLLGAYMADWLLTTFGLAAFIPAPVLGMYGFSLLRNHQLPTHFSLRIATLPLLIVSFAALAATLNPLPDWPDKAGIGNGGLVGKLVAFGMLRWFGGFGTIALTFVLTLLSTLWMSGLTLDDLYKIFLKLRGWTFLAAAVTWRMLKRLKFKDSIQFDLPLAVKPKLPRSKPKVERPKPIEKQKPKQEPQQTALPLENDADGFMLPPLSLLDEVADDSKPESEDALTQNARQIEAQLKNFNVEGVVTKVRPGPVITIYEFEPAAGVKTASIVNLSSDLARAMSAMAVRIAPIPGRNVIGIELPNRKRRFIGLKEMLSNESFSTSPNKLNIALGVDTGGETVYDDIAKMPHALIAGTTGSGKSVAMNAFIASLLYRLNPDQLKFVMIDPKMLELSIYNDIPHLLSPVITDPNKAAAALKWVVGEMENRYKLMSELGTKNLQSFNAKLAEMLAEGEIPTRLVQVGFDPATGQPKMEKQPLAEKPLPYIVVVIDELADLMMVAGKQVEMYIARIAQMARAAGIHLLVATQRPSVDVVTGLIKANIPTRISFSVTSKIDSRTVLDQMGAEQLLGKGDMLFMANGANTLQRLHGAFVSENECNAIAQHLREQGKPQYQEDIFASPAVPEGGASGASGGDEVANDDPLYLKAIEIIAREQKASTSFIQRHLKIGYNKAAGLIDKLEADGLISAADHVGKREVIVRKPPEDGY